MPWQFRLRPGSYTVNGVTSNFQYEDLRKIVRKKTIAHEFPGVDGTYIRDLGIFGTVYPMRIFFSGDAHDIEASVFENLLRQTVPAGGQLNHPLYGVKTVLPVGEITRIDPVKTAGNQTIFEMEFWETIPGLYPSAGGVSTAMVDIGVETFAPVSATVFLGATQLTQASKLAEFLSTLTALKNGAVKGMALALDGTSRLANSVARADRLLSSTLDTFIGGPLTIAFQFQQLLSAPARSSSLLRRRLEAYQNLADSIFGGNGTGAGGGTGTSASGAGIVDPGTGVAGRAVDASNLFHANRLVAESVVLAVVLAVSAEEFASKTEATDAAFTLIALFNSFAAWSDANFQVLAQASQGPDITQQNASGPGAIDTGESYQALLNVVQLTLQYLISTAFTLEPERVRVEGFDRTVLDLAAELYGESDDLTLDERADELIRTNDLTGDQILELKAGTRIRYYG